MNDTSLPELDGDAKAMLRAFRAEHRLPDDVHERVWDRVEASVEHERRGRFVRGGVVLGVLAAAAAAVLWLGGGLSSTTTSTEVPNQAGYGRADGGAAQGDAVRREPSTAQAGHGVVTPKAGGAGDAASTADGAGDAATPEASDADGAGAATPEANGAGSSSAEKPSRASVGASSATSAAKAPRASKHRPDDPETAPSSPSEPPVGGTLAEENRLLSRARAALLDERPEHAISWLREHAKVFPQGVLAQERDALWAVALCEGDRPQQGRPAARAFLQAHPDSALATRVRDACLAE